MSHVIQLVGWTLIHFVWQGSAIRSSLAAALRLLRRRPPMRAISSHAPGWRDARRRRSRPHAGCAQPCSPDLDAIVSRRPRCSRAVAGFVAPIAALGDAEPDAHRAHSPSQHPGVFAAVNRAVAADRDVLAGWRDAAARVRWPAGGVRGCIARRLPPRRAGRRLAADCLPPRPAAVAHVVESALVDVPTVVGWLRPVILLPVAALARSDAGAGRSDSRARARAHPPARLRGQPAADDRRNAAVLSPGGLVDVVAHPRRARTLLRRCRGRACAATPSSYAQALAELETWRIVGTSMALAATGGSLLEPDRRLLRDETPDQSRSPGLLVTLALTAFLVAGAGAFTWLPGAIDDGWVRRADGPKVQRLTERSTPRDQGTLVTRNPSRSHQGNPRARSRGAHAGRRAPHD